MKKISFLVLVLILLLAGCATTKAEVVPEEMGTAATFEEAVFECYRWTAERLFYSSDGKTLTAKYNEFSGPDAIPGVCTDYAIEFAYCWNVIKRYDVLYGKPYISYTRQPGIRIEDVRFARKGTVGIRQKGSSFASNWNDKGAYGVYRDAVITKTIYSGKRFRLYGKWPNNHAMDHHQSRW